MIAQKTIETPAISHAKISDWDFVYKPAEDSFLLLDALEKELDYIYKMVPRIVLEVGSGSGMIITALSSTLKPHSYCLAIDISSYACKLTKLTSTHNQESIDVVQGDLMFCMQEGTIDLIVFNPPYVQTPSSEVRSTDILTRSWAGGIDGMEVISRFINLLPSKLSKNGFGYILVVKENQPYEIVKQLFKMKFQCDVIARRKIRCEELFVLKFTRKNDDQSGK